MRKEGTGKGRRGRKDRGRNEGENDKEVRGMRKRGEIAEQESQYNTRKYTKALKTVKFTVFKIIKCVIAQCLLYHLAH